MAQQRKNNSVVVFTGGGTGGHVYPGFPIIDRLKTHQYEIVWMGSKTGMERVLVEREGIPYIGIPAGKLRRYFSLKNFTDVFRIAFGFFAAWHHLRRIRPSALFSNGGFVSVPPVAAARLLRIPVLTHESDSDPGLATKINIRLGAEVLVPYEKTLKHLPIGARALVTGNPVRDAIFQGQRREGRRIAGLADGDDRPLVLVLGGSLGARQVNELVEGCLDRLLEQAALVHQVGQGHPTNGNRPGYLVREYFHDEIPHLLAAADLAVARAGAGTIWELAATGTPAILVPLGGSSRGDQGRNAALVESLGMAVNFDGDAKELGDLILNLLSDFQRRDTMSRAARTLPAREAADVITHRLLEVMA